LETNQNWIGNVAILNKILAKETWYNTFFAKFSGNVDISSDDNGNKVYTPSGNPIEVLNDFIAQGRDNMLVPFLRELTGSPVFGDTLLKGTGEDQSLDWLRTYVNQYRKAVMKRSGQMSEQRQKLYKLYDESKKQLSRWFAKYENQAIFASFYEGVSPNLSIGTNDDGLGLNMRYHPNWYINDTGVLTTVGTEKKTKTAGELTTSVGNADTKLTADILMQLRTKCMNLRIPTMETKVGNPYWCMVVHPHQYENLMSDTAFLNANREAYSSRMLEMPELAGAQAFYAGFAIYEDIIGIRGWDTTNENFGLDTVSTSFEPTTITNNLNALVFGKSAMSKAVARDLHFTNEVDDHANTIEIGGAQINGYNRNEYFTEATSGESGVADVFKKGNATRAVAPTTASINQSSLILMTNPS
tara:strand:- start:372 stop:1613 length:1242 start_codon:yes stop_codon:yes gene_type:complete